MDPRLANTDLSDKALRSCCDQAVCISVAVLSDTNHKRVIESALFSSEHIMTWRTNMVKSTKSSDDVRKFITAQVTGSFMTSCVVSLLQLTSPGFLSKVRFIVPLPSEVNDLDEGDVALDEDFALLQWDFSHALYTARMKRWLFLFGWPYRWAGVLAGGRYDKSICGFWKQDWQIYDEMSRLDHPSPKQKQWIDSHLFTWTVNKQWKFGTDEVGCDSDMVHKDLFDLAHGQFAGLITTTICEEQVGVAKNAGEVKVCSRYRRPEVAFNKLIHSNLPARFDYDFIEADRAPENRQCKLPDEAFRLPKSSWSLPLMEIQGASQRASFYSPTANNWTTPVANLHVGRHAKQAGDLRLIDNAHLGEICNFKHHFVYELEVPGGGKQWVYPLHYFKDSSVLAVPLVLKTCVREGTEYTYFEEKPTQEPYFFSLFEFKKDARACTVLPHSWSWQCKVLPPMRGEKPGIRIFKDGDCEWIPAVGAREAFWLLSETVVVDIATALWIHLPAGASLLECIIALIMGILKCTKTHAMVYAHKRLVRLKGASRFSNELLQCEEAMSLLDRDEFQDMVDRKKHANSNLDDTKNYGSDYAKHRQRCRGAAAAAHGGGEAPKYPDRIPLAFSQPTVQRCAPPGAHTWKGNVRNEWWGHLKPCSRVVRKLSDFGNNETEAIRSVLQELWIQYNERETLPRTACPIAGLF